VRCTDSRHLAPHRKRVRTTIGFDTSHRKSGAFGTLAILLEVSIKVLPRPDSEIILTGRDGHRSGDPAHEPVGTKPAALSGAVCDGQALWVRLPGERRALEQARAAMGTLDQAPEAGFWEAVRSSGSRSFATTGHCGASRYPRQPAPWHCLETS